MNMLFPASALGFFNFSLLKGVGFVERAGML
jgi:hypothetical protein